MAEPVAAADHLHRRLVEFVGFVRGRGVPVGIGAEVDLARAVEVLRRLDRESLRHACVTVLAKSPEEARRVRDAFDLYFVPGVVRPEMPSPGHQSRAVSPRAPAGRAGRPTGKTESTESPESTRIGTYSPEAPGAGHPLPDVSPRELLTLRRGARRFRRRVATLPGRRRIQSRRGPVDGPATVRRALRQGGESVELVRRAARPGRCELAVLWDVSGSMREHEGPLFALVYSLERVSRGARVFAFSTRVDEITDEIRRHGYSRARRAVASRLASAEGGTQIGPCLEEFSTRFPGVVGDRTTVVVVSDGWDRAESAALAAEFRRLQRRAHRIVWVSPYARHPGFEPRTTGLRTALPLTDELLGPEDFQSAFPRPPLQGRSAVGRVGS